MKQRVNLYQAEFRPEVSLLSLNFVVIVFAVALITMFIWGFSASQQLAAVEKRLSAVKTDVQTQRRLIATLESALEQRVQDPQILAQLTQQQQKLMSKSAIAEALDARAAQKSQGFSGLMLALSAQHDQALWLTRIQLDENALRFEGGTLDSAAVPNWVSELSDNAFFAGRDFATARLFRDQQDTLRFMLSSNPADRLAEADSD